MFSKNRSRAEALLLEIVQKREKMIRIAEEKGYTSRETVECSQELDELLNTYQKLLLQRKERKKRPFFSFLSHSLILEKLG